MSMPFYVPPEQAMKDKADYARKGIARGRSLVATVYGGGILLAAENTSRALHKIAEIYDRIAFAGVGRFNEFDQLRVAGVRHADSKGFAYSREDVDARSLANGYAQAIGQVFTHDLKPLEVEILVAEVGTGGLANQLYHILYDGSMADEDRFCVLGGDADAITERLEASWRDGWSLSEALVAAVTALTGGTRTLGPAELEVAVLEARRPPEGTAGPEGAAGPAEPQRRRAFRRIVDDELAAALALAGAGPAAGS